MDEFSITPSNVETQCLRLNDGWIFCSAPTER